MLSGNKVKCSEGGHEIKKRRREEGSGRSVELSGKKHMLIEVSILTTS